MSTPTPKGQLAVISGPSGVGKTTIIARLIEDPMFALSVSATTRPPRSGEQDGREYFFLDRAEFDRRVSAGQFIEWACVHGTNLYGTLVSEVERITHSGRIALLDIDVQGAMSIRGRFPAKFVFIAPPSFDELLRRIDERQSETVETRAARMESARREMAASSEYDHVVVNDDLNDTVATVREILLVDRG